MRNGKAERLVHHFIPRLQPIQAGISTENGVLWRCLAASPHPTLPPHAGGGLFLDHLLPLGKGGRVRVGGWKELPGIKRVPLTLY